jgi:hypothetical protein
LYCSAVAGSGEEESDDEEEQQRQQQQQDIEDETGTNLVNLRRTIYLTIMSSLDFEEAGHKLMKIQLAPGQVSSACHVFSCCVIEGDIKLLLTGCVCLPARAFMYYCSCPGSC